MDASGLVVFMVLDVVRPQFAPDLDETAVFDLVKADKDQR